MAYTTTNFKSKKAFKEAVARGESVGVYQLTPYGSETIIDGRVAVEGPHYPEPHRWYASVEVAAGRVVKVK